MNKRWLGIALVGLVGCGALDDAQDAIKETEAKVERTGKLSKVGALVGVSQAPTKAEMPDRTTEPVTTTTAPASFLAAALDKPCETVNRNACLDENSDTCEIGVVWNACTDPEITGAAHFKAVSTATSVDFSVQFTDVTVAKVNIDGQVQVKVTHGDNKLKTLTLTDTATYKYSDPLDGEKTITPATSLDWNVETQVLNLSATGAGNSVKVEALTFSDACASKIVSGKVTLTEGAVNYVFNFASCGKGTYTNANGTWDMDVNEHGVFVGFKPGNDVLGMGLE